MSQQENTEIKDNSEDEYTKLIGQIGKWQILVFMFTGLPLRLVLPNIHFGIILMAPKTMFRCVDRGNSTEESLNMTCYSDCMSYEYWSDLDTTIIEQWNLICDRAWLADFSQTACMFGVLFGSALFGFISDRYGRSLSLTFSALLESCLSFALPFSPDIWSFTVIRFFLGVSTGGTMLTSFVLLMEIFGPKKRELLGSLFLLPAALGHIIMATIAFYFRTWRSFNIGMGMITLVYLTYYFCLPESPKWLISVGRSEEACKVMMTAAKWNKLPTKDMKAKVDIIAQQRATDKQTERKATFMDMVKLPSLRIKNLCSCLLWFSSGLTFYGSNQYFGQTSSNVFLTLTLIGVVEIPGIILGGYVSKKLGRRVAISTFLALSGIGNGLLALPDEWYYTKICAGSIGISCSGAVFSLIYVYSSELFPTVARNMGVGMSSTANRVGSMLAPFVGSLKVQIPWLPPAVFAVAPLIGLGACWCLPETKGKKLDDHLQES